MEKTTVYRVNALINGVLVQYFFGDREKSIQQYAKSLMELRKSETNTGTIEHFLEERDDTHGRSVIKIIGFCISTGVNAVQFRNYGI